MVFKVFTCPELRTGGVNISVNLQHPTPEGSCCSSSLTACAAQVLHREGLRAHTSQVLSPDCSKALPTTSRQAKNAPQSLTCPLHLKEGKEEQKVLADSHQGWLSKAWEKKITCILLAAFSPTQYQMSPVFGQGHFPLWVHNQSGKCQEQGR